MAFCSGCGITLDASARFCANCGAPASPTTTPPTPTPLSTAPPPLPTPAARQTFPPPAKPKRGGRLALKGFGLFFVLAMIFGAVASASDKLRSIGMSIAFAMGAAYIVLSLRSWKRNGDLVKSAGVAWTVSILMLLMAATGLLATTLDAPPKPVAPPPTAAHSQAAPTAAALSTDVRPLPPPAPPPEQLNPRQVRKLLLDRVDLKFHWRKEGFGNVMEADFIVTNPTEYRFKDFEVTCEHSAPSGTVIDRNTRTIYEIVQPHGKKTINNMNMGFIHTQATRSGCRITDLEPVP